MFLFESPAECALVVREHLPDTLVVHVLVVELFLEKFVLLSDLVFVAHGHCWVESDKCLGVGRQSQVRSARTTHMTKGAVLETYREFLDRMTDEVLDVVSEKAGDGLAGRAVRRGAKAVTGSIEDQMRDQGRVLVEYTAARVRGETDLDAYRREFLETNPVYVRYDGDEEAELEAELLGHFDRAASDLEPLVASETDDFWAALTQEYIREEAEGIVERHFSQAETFTQYRDGVFRSQRIGDLVIDVIEEGERRFREQLFEELDRAYGEG